MPTAAPHWLRHGRAGTAPRCAVAGADEHVFVPRPPACTACTPCPENRRRFE
jgi:hypothetical protein